MSVRPRSPYFTRRGIPTGIAVAAVSAGLVLTAVTMSAADTDNPARPTAVSQSASQAAGGPVGGPVGAEIVRSGTQSGDKRVSLTFDDGPDPKWTPQVLDLLAVHNVKATFFLLGPNAEAHPDLVKRIVAEGHRLGNHSVHHDTAMDKKDAAYQSAEILDAKSMIDRASGGAPLSYYRAPGGAFTPETRQLAADHGMANIGWAVDPDDYKRPGASVIADRVRAQIGKRGSVVLLHDGGGERSQSVAALKELLDWFDQEGYTHEFPAVPNP